MDVIGGAGARYDLADDGHLLPRHAGDGRYRRRSSGKPCPSDRLAYASLQTKPSGFRPTPVDARPLSETVPAGACHTILTWPVRTQKSESLFGSTICRERLEAH